MRLPSRPICSPACAGPSDTRGGFTTIQVTHHVARGNNCLLGTREIDRLPVLKNQGDASIRKAIIPTGIGGRACRGKGERFLRLVSPFVKILEEKQTVSPLQQDFHWPPFHKDSETKRIRGLQERPEVGGAEKSFRIAKPAEQRPQRTCSDLSPKPFPGKSKGEWFIAGIPKLSVAAGILPAAEGVHLAARGNA